MKRPSEFPAMALCRHRMGTDGAGVTTLVAAAGCPLRCRWCLNAQCFDPKLPVTRYTPESLYAAVKIDALYFLATGGGVTFGGGEPLSHADFIADFRACCGPDWSISIETSLNVPEALSLRAAEASPKLIVDIKDMNPEIYRRYTGRDNARVISNLERMLKCLGPERIRVRVPRIPDFNTRDDQRKSVDALKALGISDIECFDYLRRPHAEAGEAPVD